MIKRALKTNICNVKIDFVFLRGIFTEHVQNYQWKHCQLGTSFSHCSNFFDLNFGDFLLCRLVDETYKISFLLNIF